MDNMVLPKEIKSKKNLHSCKSCGATLIFSPEKQGLYCESCQSETSLPYIKDIKKHSYDENVESDTPEYEEWKKANKALKCPTCGASVILNSLEYSKICPYCNSSLIAHTETAVGLKPDTIIPFSFNEESAVVLYKEGMRKKWFVPNIFKKNAPVDKIKGIYIPSFGFDTKANTKYSATLVTRHTSTDRNGHSHTHESRRNIAGIKDTEHINVLVESSSHLNQIDFEGIEPFDMKKAVVFVNGFILGYSVEHYQSPIDKCKEIADNIIKESIKNQILAPYSYSYVENYKAQSTFFDQTYFYCLLPTYQTKYEYKGKNYITYMNGQTGKVGKNVPRSVAKITSFALSIVAIITAIILLVVLFS